MEIILSKSSHSLNGRINRSHGYYIREIKGHFFGQRCRNNRWADGHLNFILDLAGMAGGIIVSDIRVRGAELNEAIDECYDICLPLDEDATYNAKDVLQIKADWNL